MVGAGLSRLFWDMNTVLSNQIAQLLKASSLPPCLTTPEALSLTRGLGNKELNVSQKGKQNLAYQSLDLTLK